MSGRFIDPKFAMSSEAANGGLQHRLDEIVTATKLGKFIAFRLQCNQRHRARGGDNERGCAGSAHEADRGTTIRQCGQHQEISRSAQTHSFKTLRDTCTNHETFGMTGHQSLTMRRTMVCMHVR
jgi:hypothetical protein